MSAEKPAARSLADALSRVDPSWDAARTERALAGIHRRRARRRATTVLGAAVLLGAGALLGASQATRFIAADVETRRATSTEPRERAREAEAEAAPDTRVVRLADGSRVTPDEGAEVVVAHVSAELVAVRVDRGAARVDVVPGLSRRFEVAVGAITVTVLGTVFGVERLDDERARVWVERGHVEVAWAAGEADLFAGDEGTFPRPDASVGTLAEATELAGDDRIAARSAGSQRGEATRSEPAESWRELAHASRYDEAYEALGGAGERERTVSTIDAVEDLLLGADVARLSGHPAEALPWLEAVERDHAGDPRAVLAAFTRGRILMDLGRPRDAAVQLERVLAMEPSGSLAEDALARAALAHDAAGDRASASALAGRYFERHPDGRWARRIRSLVGRAQ